MPQRGNKLGTERSRWYPPLALGMGVRHREYRPIAIRVVQRGCGMVYTFDSLGCANTAWAQDHAEAHAEAARDFIMAELATKTDLLAVRGDLLATEQRLQTELRTSIETQTLRLTVRLGAMLVVGIGALATIQNLVK